MLRASAQLLPGGQATLLRPSTTTSRRWSHSRAAVASGWAGEHAHCSACARSLSTRSQEHADPDDFDSFTRRGSLLAFAAAGLEQGEALSPRSLLSSFASRKAATSVVVGSRRA